MGKWIKKVKAKDHHTCKLPKSTRLEEGSVYECRCGVQWLLTGKDYVLDGN